jgi:hypothetical protein
VKIHATHVAPHFTAFPSLLPSSFLSGPHSYYFQEGKKVKQNSIKSEKCPHGKII